MTDEELDKFENEANAYQMYSDTRGKFSGIIHSLITELRGSRAENKKRMKVLTEALKFYADLSIYEKGFGGHTFIELDGHGSKARQALRGMNEPI